jgi:hypothetical protein
LSGSGSNAANYTINDPAPINGANMSLSTYNNRTFDWVAVYAGEPDCPGGGVLAAETLNPTSCPPQPIAAATDVGPTAAHPLLTIAQAQSLGVSSVISGSVGFYRMTDVTMTLLLTADSEAGQVTEMLVWTDSMTATGWQTFTAFAYMPVSAEICARFRDAYGNTSDVVCDTLFPNDGPITAPFEISLPVLAKESTP